MSEPFRLTAEEERFVEALGLHFEALGVPRIGGRVFGLLLLAPRPLTLDEIADLLVVSRASISTNTRFFIHAGVIELWTVPGDRRRYYVFSRRAWEHRFETVQVHARQLARLIGAGQAALAPRGPVVARRFEVAAAFSEYLDEAADRMRAEWRERQAALEGGAS